MNSPKDKKGKHTFIKLVNYYRYTWERRSHMLQPLTKLTSKKLNLVLTSIEHDFFDEMKQIAERGVLL